MHLEQDSRTNSKGSLSGERDLEIIFVIGWINLRIEIMHEQLLVDMDRAYQDMHKEEGLEDEDPSPQRLQVIWFELVPIDVRLPANRA